MIKWGEGRGRGRAGGGGGDKERRRGVRGEKRGGKKNEECDRSIERG